MILRFFQICLTLILLNSTVHAWVVYDDGRYTIESQEVEKHIQTVYLNEDQKISLFNKAGRDYEKYLANVQNWIQSRFTQAVKELSFYKLVEKISYIESKRIGYYIAFQNADEVSLRKIRFKLHNNLRKKIKARVYNNKNLSIQQRQFHQVEYAKNLVQKGYPRKKSENYHEVYQNWYQDQLDKIEIQSNLELISQGIKEFENFIQSQGYEFRFMSPLEVDIAFNDAKHLLNRWKSENRSHTETYRFLKSNPNVDALVKDFYPESPRYLSIQKIKDKYSNRLNEIKRLLKNNKSELTAPNLIDEIISIKDLAKEMLRDGLSDDELSEGQNSMMEEYQKTGEYHFLYTARAFDLAKSIRLIPDEKLNSSIKNNIKSTLSDIFKNLDIAIENDSLFSNGYSHLSISEAAKRFASSFISASNHKEHESKLLSSAIWIIKLKFENLFKDFPNTVKYVMLPENEAKILVENKLKEEERVKVRRAAIEDYTLNMFIKIQPTPNRSITGKDVFEYLFTD